MPFERRSMIEMDDEDSSMRANEAAMMHDGQVRGRLCDLMRTSGDGE